MTPFIYQEGDGTERGKVKGLHPNSNIFGKVKGNYFIRFFLG